MSPTLQVVVAPDSFKGSATAVEVASAIGGGWSEARPGDTVVLAPMADGGEGTIDALALAIPGSKRMPITVTGPVGEPVEAEWLLIPGEESIGTTGVVELANTSGITLLSTLAPMDAQTSGFGEAIVAALDHGVEKLLLAIGGSASTDGGVGALTALGARFLDPQGNPILPGGAGLADLVTVDFSGLRALPEGGAEIITDVTNPLLAVDGAAAVFGPQKGADMHQVAALDRSLAGLVRIVGQTAVTTRPREAARLADPEAPGSGAAGGTGYGLALWGAVIRSGAETVATAVGLERQIREADVVITGEGRFDSQSAAGKVPSFVVGLAEKHGTFPLLVAGSIEADPEEFAASVSLSELAGSPGAAMENPVSFLWAAGRALANGGAKTSTSTS
ncbi:glycerate kinase [Subtercola boreus]|uniref:Glycerate kinase n=1 Tax=Subtercola boreus TaxID=120213 RepID=A0A3E0VEE0_9MICO|nr:glycerate kinase [Subtercola boreus]RFA08294.1 glycerate kinase [Subtercola boreus]TQL54808.1 glycerate kinase [Subtercola boreus]